MAREPDVINSQLPSSNSQTATGQHRPVLGTGTWELGIGDWELGVGVALPTLPAGLRPRRAIRIDTPNRCLLDGAASNHVRRHYISDRDGACLGLPVDPPRPIRQTRRGGFRRGVQSSALALPTGWRAAKNLNEQAGIQAIDPLRCRYVIVISEFRGDLKEAPLDEVARDRITALIGSKRLIAIRGPWDRTVGGHEAVQFEIDVRSPKTRVRYLHTTVSGQRGLHQIVAWSTRLRYSRKEFDQLLDGFRELPHESQESAADVPHRSVPVVSNYRVH